MCSSDLRIARLYQDGGGAYGIYGTSGEVMKFPIANAGGPDVAITGSTTEQVLATLSLPADFLGANGFIRGMARFQFTNNANNKTLRTRLGGISGTSMGGFIVSINGYITYQFWIQNKGAKNSQIGNATDGDWQNSGTQVPQTGSVDTTTALDVVITGQLATSSDTLTLKAWYIEAVPL